MSDPSWEPIAVAIIGPAAAAVFGFLAANLVTAKAQQRREAAEIRQRLASELADTANALYLELQAFWRAARTTPLKDRESSAELRDRLDKLESVYTAARRRGQVLEQQLRIFFASEVPARSWHAVTDLLTVRYFLLWESDGQRRRSIREKNKGSNHSGLNEDQLNDPELLLETYRSTLAQCVQSLWLFEPDPHGRHVARAGVPTWSTAPVEPTRS
jgi:hypothetical protein